MDKRPVVIEVRDEFQDRVDSEFGIKRDSTRPQESLTCTCGHTVAEKEYGHTWWVYNGDCAHVNVAVFPVIPEKSDIIEGVPDEGYCPQKGCGDRVYFLADGTPVIERRADLIPRAVLERALYRWMPHNKPCRCDMRLGMSPGTKDCDRVPCNTRCIAALCEAAIREAQITVPEKKP